MSTGWGTSSGFGGQLTFSGGGQQPATGSFGSTANNSVGQNPSNTQGTSGGLFGNTSGGGFLGQNSQNQSLGGLFGSSGSSAPNSTANQASTGGLFGNSNANTNSGSTGLFGNTANKPPATTTGGLFGNSNTTGNAPGNSTTGLFGAGNTNTSSAPSGGLFGNNNTTNSSGGLFGSSNAGPNANASSGGLFGAKPASGGLFGGSTAPTTGGLFGGNSTSAAPQTSGGGLFSQLASSTGGLFGSSAQTKPSTGLFGQTSNSGTSNTGGLFGNSSTTANRPTGGLFGQQANTSFAGGAATAANSSSNTNPYASDLILSTINRTEGVMPLSITGALFARNEPSKSKNPEAPKSQQPKSSLLNKLAQTFNIFRTTVDFQSRDTGISKLKGIFTQLNFVKSDPVINKTKYSVSKPRHTSNAFIILLANQGADVKRLVIKSKPLKFHLINADKVFNAKRKRVLALALQATSHFNTLTDDEDDDVEQGLLTENVEKQVAEDVPLKTTQPDLVEEVESETEENIDGYWCSPTINELRKFTPAELAYVDNFIVGRYNVGQIAYNYPVDLFGLFSRCDQDGLSVADELFGKIVKMRERVVQVYDFDDELNSPKPPIGFELNVPATITIKTPPKRNVSKHDHIKRLQNMTGMEFVTFDPLTDNWTFKVKHFSVWGLIDDSEVEEEEDAETKRLRELKKKQDSQENEASVIYSRIYENEEYNQQLKRQKIGGTLRGVPGGWDYDATVQSGGALVHKQKLVEDEINRLLNIYKEDKSVDALAANASDITLESDSEEEKSPGSAIVEDLYSDEVNNYDYLKQIVSVLPPNTDLNDLVDEKAYEPNVENEGIFDNFNRQSALATSKDWLLQLELANGIDSALTPYLTIPRNQKLSLKAINEILFSDFDRNSVDSNQISTPIKELPLETKFIAPVANFDISSVSRLVQNLLLEANIDVRSNKFPRLQLDASLSFKEAASFSKPDSDSEILALASILFDKVDLSGKKYESVVASHAANSSLIQRLKLLEQKKEFAAWLKKNNKTATDSHADSLTRIANYVIRGEVNAAVQLALSSNNTHLAAVLNLVDSNDAAMKTIVKDQIEDWQLNNAIDLIPSQLLDIYKIMAGQFDEIAKGSSFISAVGLHVFYGNPAEPLENVFKEIEETGSGEFADVLKIYTILKLEGLSASVDAIRDSGLNERVKWILLSVLTAAYGENILLYNGDEIVQNFGSLLAANGLWKEAIFVFSSLADDEKVKSLIRKTVIAEVGRIKGGENDEEEYIVKVLGVPRSLVYEAVAIEKAKKKDYWGQASALVEAELWNDAHECVCEHLGPATVIDDNYDLKVQLREVISRFPQQGSIIPKWNQGAGLYAGYFDVIDSFVQQASVISDDLSSLLNNLALVPDYNSFDVKVAISLMSKKLGDIAIENREFLPDLRKKILALKVGENERRYFDSRLIAVGL